MNCSSNLQQPISCQFNLEMTRNDLFWFWGTLFLCTIVQTKLMVTTFVGVIQVLITCTCLLACIDFVQTVVRIGAL